MTRIIFLDIDGVVLPVGACNDSEIETIIREPFQHLDTLATRASAGAIECLRKLATENGAKFVLISTWRGIFPSDFVQSFLDRVGLFDLFHEDWEAPMRGMPPRPNKGRDIGEWIGDHRVAQRDCIVIDDDDLALREYYGFRVLKQVRPISKIGFSRDELARATKMMVTQPPE